MIEILAQIESEGPPKFTAGLVLQDDVVVEAAPIVRFMMTKHYTRAEVRAYCRHRGWRISVVHRLERAAP